MSAPATNNRYVCLPVLVEALGTAKSRFLACPVAGRIVRVQYAVDVAVDANNAMSLEVDGTAVTGAGTTLTTSHVAGTTLLSEPTGANDTDRVKLGSALEFITDGGGSAGQCTVTITIEQD
jgi:hypothetical protein